MKPHAHIGLSTDRLLPITEKRRATRLLREAGNVPSIVVPAKRVISRTQRIDLALYGDDPVVVFWGDIRGIPITVNSTEGHPDLPPPSK